MSGLRNRAGSWFALAATLGAGVLGACFGAVTEEPHEAGGCVAPATACGADCVTVAADPSNCGACGKVCDPGVACVGGVCASGCPEGTTRCGGACVDVDENPAHCGACGIACDLTEVCADGDCASSCPAGTTPCGGACVDTEADPSHCGGCDEACGPVEVCVGATCVSGCRAGTTQCGDVCADLSVDPAHCGGCDDACGPTEICADSACVPCPAGATVCNNQCANTSSDPAHCGGCGVACAVGLGCVGSECKAGCHTECDSRCADLGISALHCGACFNACNPGEACINAACVACPPGTALCNDHCTSVLSDPANCGYCGKTCGPMQACVNGVCDGACVDDVFEPNDAAGSATPLAWYPIVVPTQRSTAADAFLCGGDEDWFTVETASLNLLDPILIVTTQVKGWDGNDCTCSCREELCTYLQAKGPQHTLVLEIYNATTLALLASATTEDGFFEVLATGPELNQDLLLRFLGPAPAEYPYNFSIVIRENNGEEGSCEC